MALVADWKRADLFSIQFCIMQMSPGIFLSVLNLYYHIYFHLSGLWHRRPKVHITIAVFWVTQNVSSSRIWRSALDYKLRFHIFCSVAFKDGDVGLPELYHATLATNTIWCWTHPGRIVRKNGQTENSVLQETLRYFGEPDFVFWQNIGLYYQLWIQNNSDCVTRNLQLHPAALCSTL